MTTDYLFLLVFLAVAIVFPLIPLGLAWLWAHFLTPGKPSAEKQASYECGIRSEGPARVQFHSQFYLYGLVFLVLNVETVFLLPFASAFLQTLRRRVSRDDGFRAPARRRFGVGMVQGRARMEMIALPGRQGALSFGQRVSSPFPTPDQNGNQT